MPLPKNEWYKNWDDHRPADWKEALLWFRDIREVTPGMIFEINHKKRLLGLEMAICSTLRSRRRDHISITQIDTELKNLGIHI